MSSVPDLKLASAEIADTQRNMPCRSFKCSNSSLLHEGKYALLDSDDTTHVVQHFAALMCEVAIAKRAAIG